jgi:hypothetical protein
MFCGLSLFMILSFSVLTGLILFLCFKFLQRLLISRSFIFNFLVSHSSAHLYPQFRPLTLKSFPFILHNILQSATTWNSVTLFKLSVRWKVFSRRETEEKKGKLQQNCSYIILYVTLYFFIIYIILYCIIYYIIYAYSMHYILYYMFIILYYIIYMHIQFKALKSEQNAQDVKLSTFMSLL